MMMGQLYVEKNESELAIDMYKLGIKNCPESVILWSLLAYLIAEHDTIIKSRAILEQARQANQKNAYLWIQSIRLEMKYNNKEFASNLLTMAIQECPNDGKLWFEAIFMEKKIGRKAKSLDALKNCDHDPYVILAIAM